MLSKIIMLNHFNKYLLGLTVWQGFLEVLQIYLWTK